MQTTKKGTKRYFRGQVTDGTKKTRIDSWFDEHQLKQLETLDANRSPIKLSECEVQRSSYSGDLEIKLTSKTNIGQSPKEFDSIAEPSNSPAALTPVSQIHKMGNFNHVDLKVKISQVNPPCTVPTGKLKQDLIVADSTGTIKLTHWGNEVGKYDIGSSYQLNRCPFGPTMDTSISISPRKVAALPK